MSMARLWSCTILCFSLMSLFSNKKGAIGASMLRKLSLLYDRTYYLILYRQDNLSRRPNKIIKLTLCCWNIQQCSRPQHRLLRGKVFALEFLWSRKTWMTFQNDIATVRKFLSKQNVVTGEMFSRFYKISILLVFFKLYI